MYAKSGKLRGRPFFKGEKRWAECAGNCHIVGRREWAVDPQCPLYYCNVRRSNPFSFRERQLLILQAPWPEIIWFIIMMNEPRRDNYVIERPLVGIRG